MLLISSWLQFLLATVAPKYYNMPHFQSMYVYVGFEVLTAVVMKSSIFWDMTPCSLLSVNRRFVGTYLLHLQSSAWYLLHSCFLLGLFFYPEDGGDMFLRSIDCRRTTRPCIPEDGTRQIKSRLNSGNAYFCSLQNTASSPLLFINLKIKIYKTFSSVCCFVWVWNWFPRSMWTIYS
jgi:hypothetical protein